MDYSDLLKTLEHIGGDLNSEKSIDLTTKECPFCESTIMENQGVFKCTCCGHVEPVIPEKVM
jgi:hypothetical protein